jgi:hypothetical protein
MSSILWIVFAALYLAVWFFFGLSTLRKGHTALFWIGIFFPILWIIGALMAPTPRAAGAA